MKINNKSPKTLEFIQIVVFAYFAVFYLLSSDFCLLDRNPELCKRVEILYTCRENFTNQLFFHKTNPIFPIFHSKTKMLL